MSTRSPSYPSVSRRSAILKAGELFEKERFNPISREATAKLLGYAGLTGGSNSLLSDLSHYGLIERIGKGEIRISQLFAKIKHPENPAEYRQALTTAAHQPKFFAMVRERFPDHLPSEGNLEGVLVRMGFTSAGTKPAKKAFLDTFQYLQEEIGSESHGQGQLVPLDSSRGAQTALVKVEAEPPVTRKIREARPNMKEDIYTLPEGDVVLQWPARLSQESFDEIKMWTDLMLKKLKRQVAIEAARPESEPDEE